MKFRITTGITISILLSLMILSAAFAQSFSFGLRPENQTIGYFQYTSEAGSTIEDALLALNSTDKDISIRVSVVAGHTALMGGIAFPGQADGPAGWIDLPDEGVVEIPAGKQLRLPFTVHIPEGTPPGEYVAGFLASPASVEEIPAEEQDSVGVRIVSQMGLTMIITVPGKEICTVSLDRITSETTGGDWKVIVSMQNTGNVHFKGIGEFALVSLEDGSTAALHEMKIGYFVPGDQMHYPLSFNQTPPPGEYQARVTLLGEDCVYQAVLSEDFSINTDEYNFAEAEAVRWEQARQIPETSVQADEAATLFDRIGLLFIGIALLILVLVLAGYLIIAGQNKNKPGQGTTEIQFPADNRN
ncbi:MAG: hypothetical protein JXA25_06455 [Anaerolineales bacterium]|nr:hypothetical protein [Anaerolineales bacterium]